MESTTDMPPITPVRGVDDGNAGYGVLGETDKSNAVGVHGASASTSDPLAGVLGTANSGYGVLGRSNNIGVVGVGGGANDVGVEGVTHSSVGVLGSSNYDGTGVWGRSNVGTGISGYSNDGVGTGGFSKNYVGMVAEGNRDCGLFSTCSGDGRGVFAMGHIGVHGSGDIGVHGYGSSGNGVVGESELMNGVYGWSKSGNGIRGFSKNGIGVVGVSDNTGTALCGISLKGAGVDAESFGWYALYSKSWNERYAAGYFDGDVIVTGRIQKGGGGFKIDHPLNPASEYLSHSFVESPDMKNMYDGIVSLDENGDATIELPDWFTTLNKDFRYQLTAIDSPGPNLHVAEQISGRIANQSGSSRRKISNRSYFKIAGGKSGMKVSWQVTGVRKDPWANANRIKVEETKPAKERGYYLHPHLYGKPEKKTIGKLFFPEERRKLLKDDTKRPMKLKPIKLKKSITPNISKKLPVLK